MKLVQMTALKKVAMVAMVGMEKMDNLEKEDQKVKRAIRVNVLSITVGAEGLLMNFQIMNVTK